RHDAEGEDRQLQQRTAGEQVDQRVETRLVTALRLGVAEVNPRDVHVRHRDDRPEPEQRQDHQGEEDLLPQIRTPECVRERFEHSSPSQSCSTLTVQRLLALISGQGPVDPIKVDRSLRNAPQSSVTVPPAAVIFSFAEAENACALTCTATEISPLPSTLTGRSGRTAPAATSSSTPIAPPSGKSEFSRSRLTTWYSTRNGLEKPFSFGILRCSGMLPPSNPGRMFFRAFEPLVPRPAVLPLEPSPRPTRVFGVFAPGAGRRWCTRRPVMPSFSTSACCAFAASAMSVDLLDLDQVGHRGEHPPDLRAILLHGDVTDALETQRTQRVPLVLGPSDAGLDLADLEPWHHACTSARALSSAAGATSSTALPRRFATCSGSSSDCSAATVACTTLIALA